jgi:hypothetical protein
LCEHLFDNRGVAAFMPAEQHGWSPGQVIVNSTGAKEPRRRLEPPPVPIRVRILWDRDGEEWIETVALGWTGREVHVRMSDPRYRLRAVWLDAADVRPAWVNSTVVYRWFAGAINLTAD